MANSYGYYQSPFGWIEIIADQKIIKVSLIEDFAEQNLSIIKIDNPVINQCIQQLEQYFNQQLQVFDLPLAVKGTAFQELVWHEIAKIPYGETLTYQEIAKRINRPKALRAVGTAVGKNPIPIIIPCHRVVRAGSSKIINFGWGRERKVFLQDLEK